MMKTDQEPSIRNKPGPKPKYKNDEERREAGLRRNRLWRQTERGKEVKRIDDAKYSATEKGKTARRKAQKKYSTTVKALLTTKRHQGSDKNKQCLSRYWKSPRGKSIARNNAANRRHLIRGQKIQYLFIEEIRRFYENCPSGMEVDHIWPIKGKNSCGLHVPWNLQYLPKSENRSKHCSEPLSK